MSGQNIISIYPELQAYEVESSGNKFDCRNCMGIGDCCGTVMTHTNKAACNKCKCQSLYESTNRTGDAKKTNSVINSNNCKNCDDSTFSEDYCKSLSYLENNLNAEIVDCSNTLLVSGKNNTLEDVKLRSQCNVDGNESVNVQTSNEQQQSTNFSELPIPKDYLIYGGMAFLLIFIIYFFFF
jgi:hypothetical protein